MDCSIWESAGGIGGLFRLLREHGEAIEADLHRYYGIRLSTALYGEDGNRGKGRWTPRELLVRIRQLPKESALQRKLAGPMAPWDMNALLLRRIEFQLAGANWQRGGGKNTRKPKPIDLPDGTKPAKSARDDLGQRFKNLGYIPADASA